MAKNSHQAKRSFYMMGLMEIFFYTMLGILGLVVYLRNPSIPANQSFCSIITELLPVGLKGLAIVGVLAVIMSTADSFINTSGVLFAHDVVNPILKDRLSGYHQMVLARWTSVGIGTLGIWIALKFDDILALMWLRKALWVPCLLVPILCLLVGYKTNQKRFYIAALSGVLVYVIWEVWIRSHTHINGLFPSMFTNAFILFDFKYFFTQWKKRQQKRKDLNLENMFSNKKKPTFLKKIATACEKNVRLTGTPWLLFGTFMLLNYIVPVFMWSTDYFHFRSAIILRIVSACTIILLIMKRYWPESLKFYWPMYWHFVLTFSLPLVSAFYLYDNKDVLYGGLNVILALFFLLCLVDRKTFFFLSVIGLCSGWLIHLVVNYVWPENIHYNISNANIYLVTYTGIFILVGYLLLAHRQSLHATKRVRGIQKVETIMLRELMIPLRATMLLAEHHKELLLKTMPGLSDNGDNFNTALIQSLNQETHLFKTLSNRLNFTLSTARHIPEEIELSLKRLSAKEFILGMLDRYPSYENEQKK